jgi:hypothetical protein
MACASQESAFATPSTSATLASMQDARGIVLAMATASMDNVIAQVALVVTAACCRCILQMWSDSNYPEKIL